MAVEQIDRDAAVAMLVVGLSDMIERGRLTEAGIPDDFQWLIGVLR